MDTSTLAFESVADLAIQLREGSINSTSLVEQLLALLQRQPDCEYKTGKLSVVDSETLIKDR